MFNAVTGAVGKSPHPHVTARYTAIVSAIAPASGWKIFTRANLYVYRASALVGDDSQASRLSRSRDAPIVMGRRTYSYIRVNRRRWGLTQRELALLVGLSGAASVSRIERAQQTPTAQALVSYALLFDIAPHDLLPSFHREIEDALIAAARTLRANLGKRTDQRALLALSLLDDALLRLTSPDNARSK